MMGSQTRVNVLLAVLLCQGLAVDAFKAALVRGLITKGSSLVDTTLSAVMGQVMGYSVVCGMETENWTEWLMDEPMTHMSYGYISCPAEPISPGTKEAMVTHKGFWTATGTFGTVSWLIDLPGGKRRLVVMWSAPFNFDHYTNWLAVGLTRANVTSHNNDWTNQMYYNSPNDDLDFEREQYYYTSNNMIFDRNPHIEIYARMGTGHTPTVLVQIRPKKDANLAPSLQKTEDDDKCSKK